MPLSPVNRTEIGVKSVRPLTKVRLRTEGDLCEVTMRRGGWLANKRAALNRHTGRAEGNQSGRRAVALIAVLVMPEVGRTGFQQERHRS